MMSQALESEVCFATSAGLTGFAIFQLTILFFVRGQKTYRKEEDMKIKTNHVPKGTK